MQKKLKRCLTGDSFTKEYSSLTVRYVYVFIQGLTNPKNIAELGIISKESSAEL